MPKLILVVQIVTVIFKRKFGMSDQEPIVPYPLAMMICDMIYADPGTGKISLLGCFSNVFAPRFPAKHPMLFVYAAITDGRGKTPLTLKLVDANEDREPIFQAENEVEFIDPRAIVDLTLGIQNLIFPEPGEYRFQLFAGSEFLIERRLLLIQMKQEPPK